MGTLISCLMHITHKHESVVLNGHGPLTTGQKIAAAIGFIICGIALAISAALIVMTL